MNRYWLSQNGQTTGPFAEEVLVDMWRRGQIHLDGQVCLEGMEDWMDAKFLINELEIAKERAVRSREERARRAEHARHEAKRQYRNQEKSRFLACVLNWILPGLGYFYCGSLVGGIIMFVAACGLAVLAFGVAAPVFYGVCTPLFALAGYAEAKRRNNLLADELGL